MRKLLLAVGLMGTLVPAAFGSGYQVSLQGQKQIGMGHTGTGLAWDASGIFFNPGALGFLKQKVSLVGGVSFISNKVAFRGASPRDTSYTNQSPVTTPFMLYGSYRLENIPLTFGIGVYTPYGSSVKWPSSTDNQFLLRELELRAIYVQPTVSYKITNKIGLGAGFTYSFGSVLLKRGIPVYTSQGPGTAELDGKASGVGFNVGLYVQPTEKISIGVDYRSQINMKVKGGDAKFTASSAVTGSIFPQGGAKFDAQLPLPAVLSVGVGVKATEKLTLAADFNYTFWDAYKSLRFDYDKNVNGSTFTESPRNYKNSYAARLGLDYQVASILSVRGGAYYDETPVQAGYMTMETPDANRIGLSLGIGLRPIKGLDIDASLLFINGMKREQTQAEVDAAKTNDSVLPGTYLIRAVIPGISIGYNF